MGKIGKTLRGLGAGLRERLVPALVVAVAAGIVLGLYFFLPKRDTSAAPEAPPAVPVRTELIRPVARLADTFEIKGVVRPHRSVRVRVDLNQAEQVLRRGRNQRQDRPLDEGDPVRQGQTLVQLRTDRLAAQVAQARAQLAFEQTQLQRLRGLVAENAATPSDVEDARRKTEIAEAQLATAEANLARATIAAPIDGTVNWLIEVGEQASPGALVAEIVDNTSTKVTVDIPEQDIGFFEVGSVHQVVDWPGRQRGQEPIGARITFLAEKADEGVHSTRAELTLDPQHRHKVRNGQIVSVRLQRQVKQNVILIPLTAIVPGEDEQHFVHLAEQGRAVRRPVRINLRLIRDGDRLGRFDGGDRVEVVEGLVPGERLIVEGTRFLSDGQAVRQRSVQLAEPTFARYQVRAGAGRQVEPGEVAELAARFEEIDGVLSADRAGPNDVEVPVTLDPEMLDLLGLSAGKLLGMIDQPRLSDRGGKVEGPVELRILAEAGTDPDELMQRVLAWRQDGRPIYLFQAAKPLGPIPPAERSAAIDLTVHLDGADRAYLEEKILPVLRDAAAEADPIGLEDLSRDGRARLRVRLAQNVDVQARRLAVAAAVSRRIDRLPRAAQMPQVTRAEPAPANRIHVRLAAGADRKTVQDALDRATRAFLERNNPADSDAPKLLVRRLEPESGEIAETLPDRTAQ